MNIQQSLGLRRPAVAVAFLDTPPAGVDQWAGGAQPSGCAFWREAQNGRAFYTEAADHYNCAVGAYTHNLPLPANREHELQDTLGFMVQSGYIRMEDVAGIPTLKQTPACVAYAPAEGAPFEPGVVIVAATPAQAMLLFEAAARCGSADLLRSLGRPACAALPLSLSTGGTCLSLGCRGNRTFTGLPDDELYVVVPGAQWPEVEQALDEIVAANQSMGAHYTQHQAQFAPA